ncbi:hypothetical protein ACIQ7D_18030 [Streptomyces sp. NPDC096310]|uniref:hypothetical protein n=1 Tax=Streptomyces sp. NPDC096310 TaxID=3366082 RepID=UPI00380170D7
MPWVRLDDRFPSHRKVALLSDRAFRLYVSALCWCSENLTEGAISKRELPVVARLRGMNKAVTELEAAGLWDRTPDGWMVHDYLEYNPDRARVKADRESNAARQKAWRDRKRAEREAKRAAEEADRNAQNNGVTDGEDEAGNDTSATPRRHDGDTTEQKSDAAKREESQVNAIRNGVSNGPPSPAPSPSSPSEKKQASKKREPAAPDLASGIPEQARPLVDGLTAAGVIVRWPFQGNEWFPVLALIARTGAQAMVNHSVKVATRTNVESAKYFLNGWAELPPIPAADAPRPQLRAVKNGHQPYQPTTDPSAYANGF